VTEVLCTLKRKRGRVGQIEASLRKAANNKTDKEPGTFAINVYSSVVGLS